MRDSWIAAARPALTLVLALSSAVGLSLAGSGCALEPQRKSVVEIYQEALAETRIARDPAEKAARAAVLERNAQAARERAELLPAVRSSPASRGAAAAGRGPLVSDVFADTDIREAIQSLASQAKVRVAIDDAVRGSVSGSFEGVPFEDALADLLAPRGFVFDREPGRYIVGSTDPKSAMFPLLAGSHDYAPRHLSTQELLEMVPTFALPYLNVSVGRNLMTITAPRALQGRILAELARNDQPVPQVVLEAIICEVSPKTKLELGFAFSGGFKVGGGEFANVGMAELTGAALTGPAGLAGLQSFQFLSALVHALATEGYVSVRAAPRVMVRDGERAAIAIGEETYFTVGNEKFNYAQLQTVRSGITLDLTPRIRGDAVTIKVERAEVSDELRPSQVMGGGDSHLPSLNSRRVSTTVTVKDGDTIVIGGLVRRRQVERIVKVPFLGDIPGLGLLFQKREEIEEETEVAIFLSPRIVKEAM